MASPASRVSGAPISSLAIRDLSKRSTQIMATPASSSGEPNGGTREAIAIPARVISIPVRVNFAVPAFPACALMPLAIPFLVWLRTLALQVGHSIFIGDVQPLASISSKYSFLNLWILPHFEHSR